MSVPLLCIESHTNESLERLWELFTFKAPGTTGSVVVTVPAVVLLKMIEPFDSQGRPTKFWMPRGPPFVLFQGRAAQGPFFTFVRQLPNVKLLTTLNEDTNVRNVAPIICMVACSLAKTINVVSKQVKRCKVEHRRLGHTNGMPGKTRFMDVLMLIGGDLRIWENYAMESV